MPMRSPTLLVVFLTAIALSGSANAAPITNVDLQRQSPAFTVVTAGDPGQVNTEPILLSREDIGTKPLTGPNELPGYLPGGPSANDMLPSTAASLPEPPSLLLLGSGILGLAAIWRHRRLKA